MSSPAETPAHDALAEQQAFLRRLARSLVADEHLAEDLAQDSALAALRRAPHAVASMRAWLARVARNLAANTARAERARGAHELAAPPPDAPRTPAEIAERIEAQRGVLAAFERLEEPYKSTLFLRYFDDLSPTTIAARTNVPVSTVKTRLARGLARMRAELDERHGGERGAWAVALAGGFESWEKTTLGAAAAAGGIAMGVKLALGSVAIGGAVIAGTWWALRSPVAPQVRETVAKAPAEEVAAAPASALRAPQVEERSEIEAQPAAPTTAPLPTIRSWLLELELRGQDPADSGLVSIVLSGPGEDSPRVQVTHALHAATCPVDVGALFEAAETRPDVLKVHLEHPQYLPLAASVLVPEDLRRPEAEGGQLATALQLVRAKAIVTGTVEVESGELPEGTSVALFAMERDEPADEPLERVLVPRDGRFRLRADAAAEHAVVAYVQPAERRQPTGLRPETRRLALTEREARELEPIVLGPGATIAGQVFFSGGVEPLSGTVDVELVGTNFITRDLVWKEGSFEAPSVSVEWDVDGRFRVTGLAPSLYRLAPWLRESPSDVPTLVCVNAASRQEVLAPALDVKVLFEGLRILFVVKSKDSAVRYANFNVVREEDGDVSWEGRTTDEQGRICVLLDPAAGLRCIVSAGAHQPKELRFLPAELAGGGPIEIALEEAVADTATLAIHTPSQLPEAEGILLDVRLYGRSNEMAMSMLRNGTTSTAGPRAQVSTFFDNLSPKMEIEADGTQVITRVRPASYVVVLSPRSADPDRTCLLLPTEIEIELHPGERVDRDWVPEVGGTLRVNFIGSGASSASLRDLDGQRLNVNFRTEGTVSSTNPRVPGVSELRQALAPGPYALHVQMKDGTERIVPVQIDAGRVGDVEIDVDAL